MKKIKLEEGMTARIEGGYVVIEEAVKEFKAGDCVIGKGMFYPFTAKMVEYVRDGCRCRYDNDSNGCDFKHLRLATESEKKQLMSDLDSKGKRWDAQKMQVVDLEWTPKRGEVVKTDGGRMYIYESPAHNSWHNIFGGLYSDGGEIKHTTGYAESVNPTTREERTRFFSALTEAGYKWNAKKLKLTWAEAKWVPKDGEFIMAKGGSISILGKKEPRGDYNVLCRLFKNGILIPYPRGLCTPGFITRKATDSERQLLLDALKKAGKTWNTEKKCVEDIKPKYEAGNIVTCADASIVILGAEICGGYHRSLADLSHDGKLNIHPAGSASVTGDFIRGLCAASNADRMHKALKEHGKVWNAELKRVEDIKPEVEGFKDGCYVTLDEEWVSMYRGVSAAKNAISDYCGTHINHGDFTDLTPTTHRYYNSIRPSTQSEISRFNALLSHAKKRAEDAPTKVVELTMEQVCEKLGMNVKIVKK